MQNFPVISGQRGSNAGNLRASVFEALEELAPRLVEFRRHLHQEPELSLREFDTTSYICQQLEAEGIRFRRGAGDRGVIADLGDAQSDRVVALRADCDALPILEANETEYASRRPGVMHACGHDAHTAMLLVALIALHRSGFAWPCRGIFQPAEEGDGALGMIADGALEGVSGIVGLHVDPNQPAGWIAAAPGMQTASCQDFMITIEGKGGHAARPHLSIDPIAAAASLITQIYQSVPRQMDSRHPVVVSICQIHAGKASNIIPDTAVMSGTIRALDNNSACRARQVVETICDGTARLIGAGIAAAFQRRIPGVVNDPFVTSCCAGAAREIQEIHTVMLESAPGLGAEDFADYLQHVPGCLLRLGVKFKDRPVTPLHTPQFDIDEAALLMGAKLLVQSFFKLTPLPPC